MKKILLIAFFLTFWFTNAQFFEGFENGVPGSMTQQIITGTATWQGGCAGNNGGATCPITGTGSASFFVNSYAQNVVGLTTPTLNLSSGSYILKFKHIQRSWQGDVNPLFVRISSNDGTTWTNMMVYDQGVQNATERTIILNAFTLSATTRIQFAVSNNWGYSTIVDDIQVLENTVQNDLSLESLNLIDIDAAGTKNIAGSIRNLSGNTITSFDLNWSVNGGTVYTQNITGINLTSGQTYNYNHTNTWNATPGSYAMNVTVTNVNGVADSNPANNSINRALTIASGSTSHKPLYEKFTSSTCGPCATFNNNVFNAHYNNNNQNFSLINYQVNWPGAGDPYYTAEVGQRVQYYGINGAPTLLINGRAASTSNPAILNQLNTESAKPAFFNLSATSQVVGNNMNITYNVTPFISGNFVVHAVVIEKLTTGNVATNGETSFKNVTMKMAPNASGTSHNFVDGVVVNNSITTSLSGTNIEQMNDLDVVVFIQNPTTREVFQSVYTSDPLSINDDLTQKIIKLYPNPTSNFVNFSNEENLTVIITDLSGKVVFNAKYDVGTSQIDLSHLQSGMYLAKFTGESFEQTEKIIKK
jgi:hypothetical protein